MAQAQSAGLANFANGTWVAGYRIVRLAARGGASELYLAHEASANRHVALKLLTPEAAAGEETAELVQRFEAEARTQAALRHPDIVATYAAGALASRVWIAMEWVPGHDLDRYTQAARLLPEALVLTVTERLARALAYAHSAGVVHRDVKPRNVRINLPAGLVKLTDFGAARASDGTRTRTGVILGTPLYMAPEQLAGAAADARSDLYSLGVVLFELLTGRRPHESASLGELLRQVANEAAPDLRSLRPDLPALLAVDLARLLAKRPAERHPDGNTLADALLRARLHIAGAGGVP